MKKLTKMLMLAFALLLMSGMTGVGLAQAAGTTGGIVQEVPEGYTPIRTVEDLYNIRDDLSGKYILMNDIDLSEVTSKDGDYDCGTGWDSIEEFSGVLDGNGYRIIGMHIFGEFTGTAYIGLFEKLNNATIKNLAMVDCDINVTSSATTLYVGTIAGYTRNANIDGCYSGGNVKADAYSYYYYIGGLVGQFYYSGTISNSYNLCDVEATGSGEYSYVGGIIGYASRYSSYVNVQKIYNAGKIVGNGNTRYVGSISGSSYNVSYENCFYLKGTAEQADGNLTDNTDRRVLTEAQMKSKIFTGFDFDTVWEIDPYCTYLYPQLKNNRMVRVSSVVLKEEPAKLVYNQGDELVISDAVLDITYEDDITTSIPLTIDMLSGYDMNEIGIQTVTVSYGGAETEFEIEVKEIPVTSITIPEKLSIYRSKSEQLTAVVLPENASDKTVTWESDNPAVASVNNGLISAKAKGTAVITATTANGLEAECEVTVLVAAASVTLNSTSVTLNEGESTILTAQILPLESTDTVEWMTSNANVAEVYEGNVVAKTAGVATITAYTESGVTAECTVTVQKVQSIPDTQNPGGATDPQNPGGATDPQNPGGAADPQNPSSSDPTQNDNAVSIKKVQSVKAKIKSAKNVKTTSITLKLSGLSDCNGYQIQYGTKSNFKGAKTVKKSSNSVTIKKLKKGKKYYVRVRVYKTIAGSIYYGKWSSKKTVKITK